MNSKAKGCWPFVVVAGFLALGSAPAWACDTAHCDKIVLAENSDSQAGAAAEPAAAKSSRRGRHHAHHSSRSHSERRVAKSSASESAAVDRKEAKSGDSNSGLSPAVANAKAQIVTSGDDTTPPPAAATADSTPAVAPDPGVTPAAVSVSDGAPASDGSFMVVAADELNDLDRAAESDGPGARILRPLPTAPHFANSSSDDTWSQTSMIGKVFIMFGGFLTLASAARMFFA
jgi:hypothetical protein